jgi:phosphoribosylaminoimidazolecarboxamide formyltransferase / IMP cyclohydrolase
LESFQIKNALISVFYKDGLAPLVKYLHSQNVGIYSTGGTRKFIEELGIPVIAVEDLTGYPSIFGGRVKTLHPAVFGGILYRRELSEDVNQAKEFNIPSIDLVVVDLYPFEETLSKTDNESEIIEKIDIGGVSLIRAAAKNHAHTAIVCKKDQYDKVLNLMQQDKLDLEARKALAAEAFATTFAYDKLIGNYLAGNKRQALRYGENPHQQAWFEGNLENHFTKLQGKDISYNNLLDIDAGIQLMADFEHSDKPVFAIIKHNNACGIAMGNSTAEAYQKALSADPISAFGGIMVCNQMIDIETAKEVDKIFFEILIAPNFGPGVEDLFSKKTNRTLLKLLSYNLPSHTSRTLVSGELIQERDAKAESKEEFKTVTNKKPTEQELSDLEFAIKLVKHTKSNAIILVKNNQLLASGTGQTSRVDALNQAIAKANHFGFDLNGAVMASDAFFPFPDCVEIAGKAGITAISQPGGSVKDQLSVDCANEFNIAMVITGFRHFKH